MWLALFKFIQTPSNDRPCSLNWNVFLLKSDSVQYTITPFHYCFNFNLIFAVSHLLDQCLFDDPMDGQEIEPVEMSTLVQELPEKLLSPDTIPLFDL